MNYKTITLSLTFSLTLSYIGLVFLYGSALADGITSEKVSHGRNAAEKILVQNSNIDQSDQHYSTILQKELWQAQLIQAELMLNIIADSQQVSK